MNKRVLKSINLSTDENGLTVLTLEFSDGWYCGIAFKKDVAVELLRMQIHDLAELAIKDYEVKK